MKMAVSKAAESSLSYPWHLATPRRPAFTNLHQSILDGRLQQVAYLVNRHGPVLDVPDLYGRTPLILACLLTSKSEAKSFAKLLLNAGFIMNYRDALGRTALMYAVINEHESIVKWLLHKDIELLFDVDNDLNNPLCHAAMIGNPRIAKFLVDLTIRHNQHIDYKNSQFCSAFLLACKCANYVTAYILLEVGSSPFVRDKEFRRTPLEWIRENMKSNHSIAKFPMVPEPRPHMGEVWARSQVEPFNRKETLSAFYRRRPIQSACSHERLLEDPFRVPAKLHRVSTVPQLADLDNLLTERNVVSARDRTETKVDQKKDGLSLTADAARNILLARLEEAEKRRARKEAQGQPLGRRLSTAQLIEKRPLYSNRTTKDAVHTLMDIYSQNCLRQRNELRHASTSLCSTSCRSSS